jgi:hypothetical protein
LVELTIENIGLIVSIIVGIVTGAVYIAKLNWRINKLEDRINSNPLLSAFEDYEQKDGVVGFLDSVLKRGKVES